MATYKVLQDIEAEDKLLGPLTLKQFIFAIITFAIGFINFKLITMPQLSVIRWPIVITLLFPMIIFGFLAAPISRDQPNDVWLLARIRFLIKPHIRIWNQDGISQLVTITAPKRIERALTNGLNQNEVRSRLTALANTLDSRGWAVKNVDVNLFAQPDYLVTDTSTDRLVAASTLPANIPAIDIHASDDMLDTSSNATAQHLDQMVQQSATAHRQQVIANMQNPTPTSSSSSSGQQADYWFMNQQSTQPKAPAGYATFQGGPVVTPGAVTDTSAKPTAEEEALLAKIEADKKQASQYTSHIKTIQPLGQSQAPAQLNAPDDTMLPLVDPSQAYAASSITPPQATDATGNNNTSGKTPNPAILKLANNDDLNVATIARQAQRLSDSDEEVVISLH